MSDLLPPEDSAPPPPAAFAPFEPPPFPAVDPPRLQTYPFWGWLDLVVFIVILVACLIAAAFLVTGVNVVLAAAGYGQYALSVAQAAVALQLLGFGPALLLLSLILRARYQHGLRAAAQLKPMANLGLYAGIGLATAMLVSGLNIVFKLQDLDMPMRDLIKSDADLIVIGIAAFTFGPLFEEMIFRGFLQPLFVKAAGPAVGILATAVLFALPHGAQYGWHWQLILIITIAGLVFGIIRWRAQSTTASTIAHASYNGLLLLGAILERFQAHG